MRIAERLWFVPIAFALAALAMMISSDAKTGSHTLVGMLFALVAAVVIVRLLADMRLKGFRCPRCSRPFVALSFLQRAPLSTIERRFPCQHCGLPVEAVSASVDQSAA
jgi:hypothetical protein